jgi:hypothetical protein
VTRDRLTAAFEVLVATKPVDFRVCARSSNGARNGTFPWPSVRDGVMRLSAADL